MIGDLLDKLDNVNLLDSSILIICSDHGHEFGEHGEYGLLYYKLYNELIHVPLIIHGINEKRTMERERKKISLIDLAPTILDILGIKQPKEYMGKSIIKYHSRPIFAESAMFNETIMNYDYSKKIVAVIDGDWKLIYSDFSQKIELYNIEKDFREINNVSRERSDIVNKLLNLILHHLKYVNLYRKIRKVGRRLLSI